MLLYYKHTVISITNPNSRMDKYLLSHSDKEMQQTLKGFNSYLRNNKVDRSSCVSACKTVSVLKDIACQCTWTSSDELIKLLKLYSQYLPVAESNETVVSNIIRRVLKIVREESSDTSEGLSMFFKAEPKNSCTIDREELLNNICAAIEELKSEIENSQVNIIKMALEHIHAEEVILTYGYSQTVKEFLLHGRKKRNFRVVVCESGPSLRGHEMARELSDGAVDTTLITDSSAFAMIHTVNKVIIGTHTIMADGALRAINGTHQLALAAKHYSVPVIVCAPLYKLSPTHLCSYDHDAFNKIVGPENMVNFSNAKLHSKILVSNPEFDYVPSHLIELFITNIGGHAPSYLYRIVSELYHVKDFNLD